MDSRAMQGEHPHDEHEKKSVLNSRAMQDEHPRDEHEKKSVLKKVKAKAKKIKDTITKPKHGHEHDQYQYEKQHIPDDHDLDQEDDEDEQDPEIHGAPIYDSAKVRNVTPQVQGVDFDHQHEPGRIFLKEERTIISKVNLEEDPHAPGSRFESNVPANYQTKVTDPTRTGGAEIDITPIQESIDRMSKQNEPKIVPTICETQHPSPCVGIHNQFPPVLSRETKTPYPSSTIAHDPNLPQLSSEIKTQYPKNSGQFAPVFSTSTQTQHPGHDQNLPHISNVTKTQYPSSATSHDHFTPQPHFATSHDQHLPQHMPNVAKPQHMPPSSGADSQYPSAGRHDQFKPELLPAEPKPQHYSGTSHDTYHSGVMESHEPKHQHQFASNMPQHHFSAMKTQYPSSGTHDQFEQSLPQYSSVTEPKLHHQSVTSLPQHSSEIKTHYSSSGNHDQLRAELPTEHHSPQYSGAMRTPSAGIHDQLRAELPTEHHSPQYSTAMRTQYPSAGSHDQFKAELPTENHSPQYFSAMRTQHPSAGNHDQLRAELPTEHHSPPHFSAMRTQSPSAGSHDQFISQFSTTNRNITAEEQPHHLLRAELPTEHHSPQHFNAMRTQYPSAGTHDQFTPQFSTASRNIKAEEQPQLHNESMKTSDQRNDSYTDKMYSAASTIADKATDAKNAVASKLGYGGENETTQTKSGETQSNQNSITEKISSATSAAAEKAATAKNAVASKLGYNGENETTQTKSGETQSNQNSLTDKISSATSVAVDKVAAAKDMVASKLGYGEKGETTTAETQSNQSSYTDKISSATSVVTDKVATAKDNLASKLGYGEKGETVETPSNQNQSSYTEKISSAIADKAASAKNTVASKLGLGETERDSSSEVSPAEYGSRIAASLTEKLSPVSENFSTMENERRSGSVEQDKGVSVKDYVSEKLKPGEEDRALSETISESLYKKNEDENVEELYDSDDKGKSRDVRKVVSDAVHKRGDDDVDEGRRKPVRGKVTESEEVKRRLGGWDDEIKEGELGKGMVDMVKDTVESWFGKPGGNEATQGSGREVHQSGDERRLHESAN